MMFNLFLFELVKTKDTQSFLHSIRGQPFSCTFKSIKYLFNRNVFLRGKEDRKSVRLKMHQKNNGHIKKNIFRIINEFQAQMMDKIRTSNSSLPLQS